MPRCIIVLLVMCLLSGSAYAGDTEAVNAVLDGIQKAHASRDASLLAEQYRDGLVVIGEEPSFTRGAFVLSKEKILALTQEQVWKSAGLQTRSITGRRIWVRNDLAYVRATVTDSFKDGRSGASEQYLICARRNSRWQVCFAMPALAKGQIKVKAVEPDSAADKAQIKAGDMIIARNGDDIDPLVTGTSVSEVFGVKGGPDISLTLRRAGSDAHIQVPSGIVGATLEAILVPSGTAQYVPVGQSHPVKDITRAEIDILKTGDWGAYQKILSALGFFSFRRETGSFTSLVTGQNAIATLAKQLDESRKALKPSTVELLGADVIATPNIALAAGTVRASDRSGAQIQVPTRLHVYVRSEKDWFLVADLVERFRLVSDNQGTVVLSADATRQSDTAIKGRMVGIGAKLSGSAKGVLIDGLIAGAPAELAGLKSGETIVAVDGYALKGVSVEQAVQRITGEEGTSVTLEVESASGEKRTVKIRRATIKLAGAEAKILDGGIGYVKLTAFNQETAPAVREALTKTFSAGQASGLIFDLRGNMGGLLPAVVSVAELLIDGNPPVVLWVSRQKGKEPVFVQARSSAVSALPCVVLVDGSTIGGAELLAETLRQHSRATLVGTKTAGGAVMKDRIVNPDGSSRIVEIGDFLFPQTGKTGTEGVVPDVIAPGDAQPDQVLELGKKTLLKLTSK